MTPAIRRARAQAILRIVGERPVGTQAELVRALREEGFSVTQATVSRDIRRLGLVKRRDAEGRSRYGRPGRGPAAPPRLPRRVLAGTLREFATDIVEGEALFAIRTLSGCANAVAIALDGAALDGVVATLAGDDTILVLARDAARRERVLRELRELAGAS